MRKLIAILPLAAAGAIGYGAFNVAAQTPEISPRQPAPVCPDNPGGIIVVDQYMTLDCNVNPPSQLDMVGITQQQCLDMGGAYRPLLQRCTDIDF